MEITIQALLEGKPTTIKEVNFLSTKEYVLPFLTEMKKFTDHFVINVELPKQLTVTNNIKDITYNKVWIQAIMPNKYDVLGYKEVYGFIYALDIKTPVYKIYRAYINPENNNLCVFNPEWIKTYELKPGETPVIKVTDLMQMSTDVEIHLTKMQKSFLSPEIKDCHSLLGELIDKSLLYEYKDIVGKIKLSSADVIKSYEDVYHNTTSKYFVKESEECSKLNYYNALCSQITNSKDIVNRWEKTILVGMLLNIIDYASN